jgi:hypothetical protein
MQQMLKRLPFLLTIACLAGTSPALCSIDSPLSLTMASQKVTDELNRLDAGLKRAGDTLGKSGMTGDGARTALRKLCGGFRYAVDCSAVDAKGRMVTVEPSPFRRFEGSDISNQEQVIRMKNSRRPVLSAVFRAVEGFDAADAEYPVTATDGRFLGSVSILFSPARLLDDVIRPLTQGTPLEIWAMEKGGRILYDADAPLIGLNIFTSKPFLENSRFIRLARRISSLPEGESSYWHKAQTPRKVVSKKVYWKSVSLYGAEWRLIGMHAVHDVSGKRVGRMGPVASPENRLESLVTGHHLIAALSLGERNLAMELFRDFYEGTPGIYSVQWIDEKGINRFGYPAENSLTEYDYHSGRAASDPETLRILADKKPAIMEAPLFEGRTGVFLYRPVFNGTRYLGMVYYIRIKQPAAEPGKP